MCKVIYNKVKGQKQFKNYISHHKIGFGDSESVKLCQCIPVAASVSSSPSIGSSFSALKGLKVHDSQIPDFVSDDLLPN